MDMMKFKNDFSNSSKRNKSTFITPSKTQISTHDEFNKQYDMMREKIKL